MAVEPGFPGANADMPPLKVLVGRLGRMRVHPRIVSMIGFFRQRVSRCSRVLEETQVGVGLGSTDGAYTRALFAQGSPSPAAADFPKAVAALLHTRTHVEPLPFRRSRGILRPG